MLVILSGCGRYISSVKNTPKTYNTNVNTVSTYDFIQKVEMPSTSSSTTKPTEAMIKPSEAKVTEETTAVSKTNGGKEENRAEVKVESHSETEPIEAVEDNTSVENDYLVLNNSDTDLLARIIYFESGTCSEYCQWLVGSTAMNLANEYGNLETVAFNYDIFNVANVLYSDTPSDLSYSVATRIINGDRDVNVRAFRTDYYHSFGSPYTNVDNVYFSSY